MHRSLVAVAVVAYLCLASAPTASALPNEPFPVTVAYPLLDGPLGMMLGTVNASGPLTTQAIVIGARPGTFFEEVPKVTVMEARDGSGSVETFDFVHVEFASGGFLWQAGDGAAASSFIANARYGVGLIPPVSSGNGTEDAFFLLASDDAAVNVRSGTGTRDVIPFGAVVTLRDATTGDPLPGWDARPVNENVASPSSGGETPEGLMFRLEGVHRAQWKAAVELVTLDAAARAGFSATLSPAPEVRFDEALDALGAAGDLFGGDSSPVDALKQAGALAPLLNGGLVAMSPEDAVVRVTSRGEPAVETAFSVVRAEAITAEFTPTGVEWTGDAHVALTSSGFSTVERPTLFRIPALAVILWFIAVPVAVAGFIFGRRKDEKKAGAFRLIGFVAHMVTLVGGFLVWDRAFAATFGAGFMSALTSGAGYQDAVTTAALSFAAWGLGSIAFAVPIRLAVGGGLAYSGRRKGWRGFGGAAGFLFLAAILPTYAFTLLNVIITELAPRALEAIAASGI